MTRSSREAVWAHNWRSEADDLRLHMICAGPKRRMGLSTYRPQMWSLCPISRKLPHQGGAIGRTIAAFNLVPRSVIGKSAPRGRLSVENLGTWRASMRRWSCPERTKPVAILQVSEQKRRAAACFFRAVTHTHTHRGGAAHRAVGGQRRASGAACQNTQRELRARPCRRDGPPPHARLVALCCGDHWRDCTQGERLVCAQRGRTA